MQRFQNSLQKWQGHDRKQPRSTASYETITVP
jgi:hypothetical protein